MFNRAYIKENAKQVMQGRLGIAIGASLVAALLSGGISNFFSADFNLSGNSDFWNFSSGNSFGSAFAPRLSGFLLSLFTIVGLLGLLYAILVGSVIGTGGMGWFLRYNRGENPSVGEVFAGFRIYAPVVIMNLLRTVYTFLWSLLFVIPGIVMSYAYSMADYIIYENPNLSAGQALNISKRLTYGHKADLFVFDLSYFGWYFLSLFTCGILGIVYVAPYRSTAHAGVYEALKADALSRGAVRPEEFGAAPPPPPASDSYPPYQI